jgi:hypothetical protein
MPTTEPTPSPIREVPAEIEGAIRHYRIVNWTQKPLGIRVDSANKLRHAIATALAAAKQEGYLLGIERYGVPPIAQEEERITALVSGEKP